MLVTGGNAFRAHLDHHHVLAKVLSLSATPDAITAAQSQIKVREDGHANAIESVSAHC